MTKTDRNKRNSIWPVLLTAIAVSVLVTTVYLTAFAHQSNTVSLRYSLSYILHFVGLCSIAFAMRKGTKGRISYLKSLLILCLCGIFVSVVVGGAVYFYSTSVDTTLLAERQNIIFDDITNSNTNILETAGEANVRETISKYMSPLYTALSTSAIIAVLSVLYAAFISIFAKRKHNISRNEYFNRSSTSE